jgi:hypothetical protein
MNRVLSELLRLAAIAAVAGGCVTPDVNLTPAPGSLVRTGESAYSIPASAPDFSISATVTNNTGAVLLLDGAGRDFAALEKQEGAEWRTVYHPVYTMQAAEPIHLEPGESRQLAIWLSLTPGATPLLEDVNGTYRAVFAFASGSEENRFEARTNTFQLQRATQ